MNWTAPAPELPSASQPAGPLREAIVTACCVVTVTVCLAFAIDHRQAASLSAPTASSRGEAPRGAARAELSFAPVAAPSQQPAPRAEKSGAAGQKPAQEIAPATGADRPTLTRSIGRAEAEMTIAPVRLAPTPPAGAPVRVVLMVSSGEQGSKQVEDVRRALAAAGLEIAAVNVADKPVTKPGVAYYFRPDRDAAIALRETIAPVIGAVDVQAAELRAAGQKGLLPSPGSIEISIP
ncbi:hypothetical protein CR492_05950 [Methylocella silvestris]|uniref:Uncharacterized protein n=2 Tax=Methylocella silvestris TaxID=199596 RepID=A0A2J7TJB4_METSI|nr:hypothetical protein CR492_05950 [Methylocella silvestris]